MEDTEKYASAVIVERRDLAPDLWVLRMRPSVEMPFRYGQYMTIGLRLNGRVIERPYSICSSPAEELIELFIERVPNGELSMPLYDLRSGDSVLVRKRCKGIFLREAPQFNQPHLLVSTVTGIAPFVSFVRTLQRRHQSGEWGADFPVVALQGASRSDELGYVQELEGLQAQTEWFRYIPTVSRPEEDGDWKGEVGRVEDVLRKYTDQFGVRPGNGVIYLCGNPQMIANCRSVLRRAGFADDVIREEQYWPE